MSSIFQAHYQPQTLSTIQIPLPHILQPTFVFHQICPFCGITILREWQRRWLSLVTKVIRISSRKICLRLMMRMVGRLRLSSIMWLNGCHKLAASPAYPTHPNPLYTHPNPQTPNIHTYHTATLKHSSKPCTGPKQTPYIDCWLTVYNTVECSDSL